MRALRVSALDLRQVPIEHPDAQELIEQVQEEYVVRYGGRDESPIDHTEFVAPRGAFFVGHRDGVPVVSGAWRRRSDVDFDGITNTAEIKRMYVAPAARGLGLARQMLAHLEATARAGRGGGDDPGDRAQAARGDRALRVVRLRRDSRLRLLQGLAASAVASARRSRRVQPTRRWSSDFLSHLYPTAPSAPLASCRAQGTVVVVTAALLACLSSVARAGEVRRAGRTAMRRTNRRRRARPATSRARSRSGSGCGPRRCLRWHAAQLQRWGPVRAQGRARLRLDAGRDQPRRRGDGRGLHHRGVRRRRDRRHRRARAADGDHVRHLERQDLLRLVRLRAAQLPQLRLPLAQDLLGDAASPRPHAHLAEQAPGRRRRRAGTSKAESSPADGLLSGAAASGPGPPRT